jgi:5'-AMP-activated protein kinase regulatory gamma subunit
MTVSDYVQALRLWRSQGLPTSELAARSIAEMFTASPLKFQHSSFQAVDAEDTVNQMCMLLLRSNNDYVPVVDPDNGNLVSILGYLDIIHLFTQIAKQHPTIFNTTVQVAMIGTYKNVLTAPKHSRLFEVLDAIDAQKVSALPIVDEAGRVIGSYHKADVSFIIKAADPDIVMNNLSNYRAEDSLALREQLLLSGDIMSAFQGLVLSKPTDTINAVLTNMMMARSTRVVVVDDLQKCIGVISVRDIVQHYLKASGGADRN